MQAVSGQSGQIMHKLTKNQTTVYKVLSSAKGPISAYALLDQLRGEGFRAPLQVYRALDRLLEYGLIHRLESLNSFVACAHPDTHSHGLVAFATCNNCGNTQEFSDEALDKHLGIWANASNFKISKTTLEIRGLCANCLPA